MEEKESKLVLEALSKLRAVTFAVKVFPFISIFMILVSMICYRYGSDEVSTYMDLLCYTSPMICLFMLVLSFMLKMCKWHKIQCTLPILLIMINVIDVNVCEFAVDELLVTNIILIFVTAMSLFNGYRIFFCSK